jgi:hypothetical protein
VARVLKALQQSIHRASYVGDAAVDGELGWKRCDRCRELAAFSAHVVTKCAQGDVVVAASIRFETETIGLKESGPFVPLLQLDLEWRRRPLRPAFRLSG